jgi:preprotein translocase subunit SecY
MFRRLLLVFTDKELRKKLLSVIGLLALVRLLTHIPIPVIEAKDISNLVDNDAVFGLLNAISGSGYGQLSIVMLGVGPFITASIVMQLLGVIVPKIKEIQNEEGELGRNKINRWTRFLTVPLAALNSWGILQFLSNSSGAANGSATIQLPAVMTDTNLATAFPYWFAVIASMVAGSIIVMWVGEIITEFKMGNGISLLVLGGIVSNVPSKLGKFVGRSWPNVQELFTRFFKDPSKIWNSEVWKALLYSNPTWSATRSFLSFFLVGIIALLLVVFFNDAVRKIIIVYSRRGHIEGKSRTLDSIKADLPIKVNMAGVLPIIFAISFILFPSILSRFFFTSNTANLRTNAQSVESYLSAQRKRTASLVDLEKIPQKNFLGVYLTGKNDEIEELKKYDLTEGQEIFGFTLSTQKEIKNSFFEGTPLNDLKIGDYYVMRPSANNFGFLPQFAIRSNGVLAYTFFYAILIIFFTYFYTSTIAFKTDEISDNLLKSSAYIPGYRPGVETQNYLSYISNRMNVAGSVFLAMIAVMPFLFNDLIQGADVAGDNTLSGIVGGTTILIMVSTAIETLKQIEAQATIVDYDRFVK